MSEQPRKSVVVAGATGYLGKYVVKAFKQQGYYVRVLTRSRERLFEPGPFTAPALTEEDFDDVFIGEITRPETLQGLLDGIDTVYSSVGISRQRDRLTFEQVDYQCNKNFIDLCEGTGVKKFTYVSMQGAENIMDLAITQAHEKVVQALQSSHLDYRIVRPCGYFSDMGVLYDMAKKGRSFLVGEGNNKMNPIHGWLARVLVKFIALLSTQFGDLAEFIVTAGEIDGVGPRRGTTTLRSYFGELLRSDGASY